MLVNFLYFIKTSLSIWVVAIIIGLIVEAFYPAEKEQPFSNMTFNMKYAVLYGVIIFFISIPLGYCTNKIIGVLGKSGLISLHFETTNIFLEIFAGLVVHLITDFFYYWLHRLQHTIPFLWAQHSFHHSEESLNVTTGIRHHWFEPIFQAFFVGLPIQIFFKLPPYSFGIVMFVLSMWSFFIHMNLRLNLGILTPVIVGPQLHRIHHSKLKEHWDKNYGAYFPVWDILFGTYCPPKKNEYPETGLTSSKKMGAPTFMQAFFWPMRQWIPFFNMKKTPIKS